MADPNWLDELEAYMGKPPARGALDFETVRRLLRVAPAAEEFAASALREELRGEP